VVNSSMAYNIASILKMEKALNYSKRVMEVYPQGSIHPSLSLIN
jgi:hypothetical protein